MHIAFLAILGGCGPSYDLNLETNSIVANAKGPGRPRRGVVVTLDPGSPPEGLLYTDNFDGTVTHHLATYRLQSLSSPLVETDLSIELAGKHETVDTCTITYTAQDGSTRTATASPDANGMVWFSNLGLYIPPKGSDTTFTVTAELFEATVYGEPGDLLSANWVTDGFQAVNPFDGTIFPSRRVTPWVPGNDFELHGVVPTLSLASSSPRDEAGVVGWYRFLVYNLGVTGDDETCVQAGVTFLFESEDGTGNGWNFCTNMGDPALWEFYNLEDSHLPLDDDGDWSFYAVDGQPCADVPNEPLGYAVLDFEADPTTPAEEIPAGETHTYAVEADTTGASSSANDWTRVSIPVESDLEGLAFSAFLWEDSGYGPFNGTYLDSVPGGKIQY